MIIHYDPDEYENVSEYRTCGFHKEHPGEPWAGCCCSASFTSRLRSPEEIAIIKAKRRREEEDRILAQAEAIKGMRASQPIEEK